MVDFEIFFLGILTNFSCSIFFLVSLLLIDFFITLKNIFLLLSFHQSQIEQIQIQLHQSFKKKI